jgi:hypothetical protein
MQEGVTYAKLDLQGRERFQRLREPLGIRASAST